jgi:hypothetical protein
VDIFVLNRPPWLYPHSEHETDDHNGMHLMPMRGSSSRGRNSGSSSSFSKDDSRTSREIIMDKEERFRTGKKTKGVDEHGQEYIQSSYIDEKGITHTQNTYKSGKTYEGVIIPITGPDMVEGFRTAKNISSAHSSDKSKDDKEGKETKSIGIVHRSDKSKDDKEGNKIRGGKHTADYSKDDKEGKETKSSGGAHRSDKSKDNKEGKGTKSSGGAHRSDKSKDNKEGKGTKSSGGAHRSDKSKDNKEGKGTKSSGSAHSFDEKKNNKKHRKSKDSSSKHIGDHSKDNKEGRKTKGSVGSDYSEGNNTKDNKEEHKAMSSTSIAAKPSSIFLVETASDRKGKSGGKGMHVKSLVSRRKAQRNGLPWH